MAATAVAIAVVAAVVITRRRRPKRDAGSATFTHSAAKLRELETRQVVLGGGHEIYEDDPDGVLAEVGKVLESIRSGG